MKDKIKLFFGFLGRGWVGGIRGKIGVFALILALVMFIRMFFGEVSVQKFIINIWKLKDEEVRMVQEQAKLDLMNKHIKLIMEHSPDYVEEISLKYLNMGDPNTKVLK